jgi:hypothetical protein
MEAIQKSPKIPKKFLCEFCDYNTCCKKDMNKHLLTLKHKNNTKINDLAIKSIQKTEKNLFHCENCNKKYKDNSGLWRHKKKCNPEINNNLSDNLLNNKNELINYLINENKEIKELYKEQNGILMELCKNNTITNNMNYSNNNNNNTFNLNLFLNETCKDAMNIMDFIDSVKLQLSDLENIGKLGYVDGISEIIIKNLNKLDISKRPVHCSDLKREVFYIKDKDKWEKEKEDRSIIKKVINHIAHKNIKLIPEWKENNPDCVLYHSKLSDKYNKIVLEAMGGSGDSKEKEDKIIKKIAKEITINKKMN